MASKITPADKARMTRNVLKVYRRATAADIVDGRAWYAVAHELATELAPHDVRQAAGVIAALSPRLRWTGNVRAARNAYATGHASGVLKANARKADAILAGADPADVLGGHKVRAFYACIVSAGTDPDAVCVDMHAHDIAVGRVTDDASRGTLSTISGYAAIADAYRSAARIITRETGETITPAVLQAITWTTWRRTDHRAHIGRARSAAYAARQAA